MKREYYGVKMTLFDGWKANCEKVTVIADRQPDDVLSDDYYEDWFCTETARDLHYGECMDDQ